MNENDHVRVLVITSYKGRVTRIDVARYRPNADKTYYKRIRVRCYNNPPNALIKRVHQMIENSTLNKSEIQSSGKHHASFVTHGGV